MNTGITGVEGVADAAKLVPFIMVNRFGVVVLPAASCAVALGVFE